VPSGEESLEMGREGVFSYTIALKSGVVIDPYAIKKHQKK